MVEVGSVLIALGVIGELAGGEYFRHFFDWRFPADHGEWLKVKLGRAGIVVGALLIIVDIVW